MSVPYRRGEVRKEIDFHVTPTKLQKLKDELEKLVEVEQPAAAKEVQRTGAFGDFSENAEYKEAKARLRRILARIESLKKRIAHAIVIKVDENSDQVQLGSKVVVEKDGVEKIVEIVGASESRPGLGIISHSSPIGKALIGNRVDDKIEVVTPGGKNIFIIKRIG